MLKNMNIPLPQRVQIYAKNRQIVIQHKNDKLTIVFTNYNEHVKYTSVIQQNSKHLQRYQTINRLFQALYNNNVINHKTPEKYIKLSNGQIVLNLIINSKENVQMILPTKKEQMHSQLLSEELARLKMKSSFYQEQVQRFGNLLLQKSTRFQDIFKNNLDQHLETLLETLTQKMQATYQKHQQKLKQIIKNRLNQFTERCQKLMQNLLENNVKMNQEFLFRQNKENQQIKILFQNDVTLNNRIAAQSAKFSDLKFDLEDAMEQMKEDVAQKAAMKKTIDELYAKLQAFCMKTQEDLNDLKCQQQSKSSRADNKTIKKTSHKLNNNSSKIYPIQQEQEIGNEDDKFYDIDQEQYFELSSKDELVEGFRKIRKKPSAY